MQKSTSSPGAYREQIECWAKALSQAQDETVYPALADGSDPERVRLFVAGNIEKRIQFLKDVLEFVAGVFDDFEEMLEDFVHARPMAAHNPGKTDADRFLQFLEESYALTPTQSDHVACQRARYAIEAEARQNRRGHVRFQEMASVAGRLVDSLESNAGLEIHLNPIRVWSCLTSTAFLDENMPLPVEILFFPIRESIHTAFLEPGAPALIQELASRGPWTLAEWAAGSAEADEEQLVPFIRALAEIGLVAFR